MAAAIEAQVSLRIGHLVAASDLSAAQFKLVKMTTTGVAVCAATTDKPIGVLMNKPTAGQPCTIYVTGVFSVIAGVATIVAGDAIYLKADGTVTEVATSTRIGTALEAASDGKLFTALVDCAAPVPGTV